MLLAVVKLPRLPLLLPLKLPVRKSCVGAAAVVRHRMPDDAICCCGLMHLVPEFLFLY